MGRVEDFYHTLEIAAPIIFDGYDIRKNIEQWRWYVLGLWQGVDGWMFLPNEVLEIKLTEEIDGTLERPPGDSFPLS